VHRVISYGVTIHVIQLGRGVYEVVLSMCIAQMCYSVLLRVESLYLSVI
jgi:hypothetical protein